MKSPTLGSLERIVSGSNSMTALRRKSTFEPILHGNLYGPLRDPEVFAQVALDPISHTLLWPNGADFDPETLRNWPRYRDAWIETARKLSGRIAVPTL
jgi:glycine/D-amino acid oxidase-like deaminating enzyme